jgi:uncharacterized protein with PIN domain
MTRWRGRQIASKSQRFGTQGMYVRADEQKEREKAEAAKKSTEAAVEKVEPAAQETTKDVSTCLRCGSKMESGQCAMSCND